MTIDWIATLQEQQEFVKTIADDVTKTLLSSHLTTVQASRLYRTVEQGAQTFDRIIDEMEQANLDEELNTAADEIADTWTNLSIAAANKLRALRGLEPIAFPTDDNDTT